MSTSKPFNLPRTDAAFQELSKGGIVETPAERQSRVEFGLLKHAIRLELELKMLRRYLFVSIIDDEQNGYEETVNQTLADVDNYMNKLEKAKMIDKGGLTFALELE